MLVLTRKSKQQIRVGDNVVITILKVKGQSVRVGIEAPNHVRVIRAELPLFDDAADSIEIAPGKQISVTGAVEKRVGQSPLETLGHTSIAPTLRRGLGEHVAARHKRPSSQDKAEAELQDCVRMPSGIGFCLSS